MLLKLSAVILFAAGTLASWVGEEYWSTIGYNGELKDGRTESDFLRLPDERGDGLGWIAFWITRTRYGDVHYEAFGHAIRRPDGRICGYFAGNEGEVSEVCGGFRVLSRNRYYPQEQPPFKWIPAQGASEYGTVGFQGHRIARIENAGQVIYGDAQFYPSTSFKGCHPERVEEGIVSLAGSDFDGRVYVLQKLTADVPPAQMGFFDQTYRDPHFGGAHGWEGHPGARIGEGARPAADLRPPQQPQQPIQPQPPHVPHQIVTADGTIFETRPDSSRHAHNIHPSDPRLRDPRSNPEDPRYDARFDPRTIYYDGRYNPYDPQYNPEFDRRWREVHRLAGEQRETQEADRDYSRDLYRTGVYRSGDGTLVNAGRETAAAGGDANANEDSDYNVRRTGVYRSGDGTLVNADRGVAGAGGASAGEQSVAVRVLRPGPVQPVQHDGSSQNVDQRFQDPNYVNVRNTLRGRGGEHTGSQNVDQRFQDPNYVNVRNTLRGRGGEHTGHPQSADILSPGGSGDLQVVDEKGNVYIRQIDENGVEHYVLVPTARRNPALQRSHLRVIPEGQQGSHTVDARYQDPNYQRVRDMQRERAEQHRQREHEQQHAQHSVSIGHGAFPSQHEQQQSQHSVSIGHGAVPSYTHEGNAIGTGAEYTGERQTIGGGAVARHDIPRTHDIGGGAVPAERTSDGQTIGGGAVARHEIPRNHGIGEGAAPVERTSGGQTIGGGAVARHEIPRNHGIGEGASPVERTSGQTIGGGAVARHEIPRNHGIGGGAAPAEGSSGGNAIGQGTAILTDGAWIGSGAEPEIGDGARVHVGGDSIGGGAQPKPLPIDDDDEDRDYNDSERPAPPKPVEIDASF